MPEHLYRGEGSTFTEKEDREAKAIARSEKKSHTNLSYKERLSIGYGHINARKHRKRK